MVVVTYTIKKTSHHAKPGERSGERRRERERGEESVGNTTTIAWR
jgi:hypothetical protein